jgi:hypothetical protein
MTAPVVVSRSTGFVNSAASHPVALVPTLISPRNMTSNTAPSPFVASSSSSPFGYLPYYAFDGLATPPYWLGNGGGVDWLQLDLGSGNAQILDNYSVQAADDLTAYLTRVPKTWTMRGSNDGTTFTTVDTRSSETGWSNAEIRSYTCATRTTAYRYFRLNITANNGDSTYTHVGELSLFVSPPAVTAGNLLVVVVSTSGAIKPGIDAPSGPDWWLVGSQINTVQSKPYQTVWAKIATGTDALTLVTDAGTSSSYVSYQISGHGSAVTYASIGTGNSTNADPPSCTQSGSAQDTLSIAAYTGYNHVATAAPSGYGNLKTASPSSGNSGFTSTADNALTAINTENPGVFTSVSDYWIASTILIPAGAISTKARITQVAVEVLSSMTAAIATGQSIVFTAT